MATILTSTHVENDQADTYVDQFQHAFGDIRYLQSLGYFETRGYDVTTNVQNSNRPPNLAYMLVQSTMPLGKLHSTFGPNKKIPTSII